MRKRIGIEAWLKRVYRDELPKQQCSEGDVGPAEFCSAWGGLERYAEVGALVDFARENRWGVIPDRYAQDNPHPDAIRTAEAMEGLDALELCLPDDWNPIADLGEIGAIEDRTKAAGRLGHACVIDALADLTKVDAKGNRSLKGGVRRIVMMFAVLNGEPGWEIEPPEVLYVMAGKNRPAWFRRETIQGDMGPVEIEVDGFDRKRRMPFPDAYRKQILVPDPTDGIRERGLNEVYVAALHILHAELVDKLEAFALDPPERQAQPWIDGGPAKARILLGKPLPALEDHQSEPEDQADPTPHSGPRLVPYTRTVRPRAWPARKNSPVRILEQA